MSDEIKAASNPGTGMPDDPRSQPPQFSLDYSDLSTVYTNFCHVTFTLEELILDFGLNTQAVPTPGQPIKLSHRVVMNFFTAKRLMNALMFSVSKFENAFGALELDPQKRGASTAGGQRGMRRRVISFRVFASATCRTPHARRRPTPRCH